MDLAMFFIRVMVFFVVGMCGFYYFLKSTHRFLEDTSNSNSFIKMVIAFLLLLVVFKLGVNSLTSFSFM